MNTYVWYSKSTKDSGALIGDQVASDGAEFQGTNPPKGFNGIGICFGAKPAGVFKWENRNFRALFNDPRKIAELSADKTALLADIVRKGGMVLATYSLNDESDYADVLETLGTDTLYCCTPGLTGAVKASNQDELQSAIQNGKTVAVHASFKSKETFRVYVVNGKTVVTLSKSFDEDAILRDMAKGEGAQPDAATYEKLKAWKNQGRITIGEDQHVLEEKIGADDNFRTQAVINSVNKRAEMYCIEYVKVGGNYVVNNIIFAPSVESLSEGGVSLICTQINEWAETNSKTFKESLLGLINESTEAQAEEMLGAINQYVNG
jgi:hypothetical protein